MPCKMCQKQQTLQEKVPARKWEMTWKIWKHPKTKDSRKRDIRRLICLNLTEWKMCEGKQKCHERREMIQHMKWVCDHCLEIQIVYEDLFSDISPTEPSWLQSIWEYQTTLFPTSDCIWNHPSQQNIIGSIVQIINISLRKWCRHW
jgi:hypothetical protein